MVWDEIGYEGNNALGWGNLTPQEMVRRFWEACLRGGHAGYGETYVADDDILWWAHGGVLKGESQERLTFLIDILKETPGGYLKKSGGLFDETVGIAAAENKPDVPCGYESIIWGLISHHFEPSFYQRIGSILSKSLIQGI